jgi:hypothetical protein
MLNILASAFCPNAQSEQQVVVGVERVLQQGVTDVRQKKIDLKGTGVHNHRSLVPVGSRVIDEPRLKFRTQTHDLSITISDAGQHRTPQPNTDRHNYTDFFAGVV